MYQSTQEWEDLPVSYTQELLGKQRKADSSRKNLDVLQDLKHDEVNRNMEGSWSTLLNTLQLATNAMNYQADKMDLQLALLSTLASHVANIDGRLVELSGLIKRVQSDETNNLKKVQPCCFCAEITD